MYAIFPMLAPCTITEANPVACQRHASCSSPARLSTTCAMVPDRFPAVTIACLDPCKACPTLHTSDGSNDQSVASNPVRSSQAQPVYAFFPVLASCTVTEANPVACRLTACITLKPGTSVDHACITLPDQFHREKDNVVYWKTNRKIINDLDSTQSYSPVSISARLAPCT